MTVIKIGNKVEITDNGIFMYLPANKLGYQLFQKQMGFKAEKYHAYFIKNNKRKQNYDV